MVTHAIEILDERRGLIRSILRKVDDDYATCGSCGLPDGKFDQLKRELNDVTEALLILREHEPVSSYQKSQDIINEAVRKAVAT
jgi:hypothetical protein